MGLEEDRGCCGAMSGRGSFADRVRLLNGFFDVALMGVESRFVGRGGAERDEEVWLIGEAGGENAVVLIDAVVGETKGDFRKGFVEVAADSMTGESVMGVV